MRMSTGRYLMPNRRTGIATLVYLALMLYAAIIGSGTWVIMGSIGYILVALLLTDVIEPDKLDQADSSYLAMITRTSASGVLMIVSLQLVYTSQLFPLEGFIMPMGVLAALVVVLGAPLVAKWDWVPKLASDATGWTIILAYLLNLAVVFIRNQGYPLWPNALELSTMGGLGVTGVVFLTTSRTKIGRPAAMTRPMVIITFIMPFLDMLIRTYLPGMQAWLWVLMWAALGLALILGEISFRQKGKIEVQYISEE